MPGGMCLSWLTSWYPHSRSQADIPSSSTPPPPQQEVLPSLPPSKTPMQISTVVMVANPLLLLQCSAHSGSWWSLRPSLEPVGHHSLANNHHFCKQCITYPFKNSKKRHKKQKMATIVRKFISQYVEVSKFTLFKNCIYYNKKGTKNKK